MKLGDQAKKILGTPYTDGAEEPMHKKVNAALMGHETVGMTGGGTTPLPKDGYISALTEQTLLSAYKKLEESYPTLAYPKPKSFYKTHTTQMGAPAYENEAIIVQLMNGEMLVGKFVRDLGSHLVGKLDDDPDHVIRINSAAIAYTTHNLASSPVEEEPQATQQYGQWTVKYGHEDGPLANLPDAPPPDWIGSGTLMGDMVDSYKIAPIPEDAAAVPEQYDVADL